MGMAGGGAGLGRWARTMHTINKWSDEAHGRYWESTVTIILVAKCHSADISGGYAAPTHADLGVTSFLHALTPLTPT